MRVQGIIVKYISIYLRHDIYDYAPEEGQEAERLSKFNI